MNRCFECKQVNTNIAYVCGSGVGDYFCRDCAERNQYVCPLCGSEMVPIENTREEAPKDQNMNHLSCKYCGHFLESDWEYCPNCGKNP